MLSILKHSNVFYLFLNGTFMFVGFFFDCAQGTSSGGGSATCGPSMVN